MSDRDRQRASEDRAPLDAEEQGAPEPERPRRPAEEAGMAPHQREDPPQAEGDRESAEEEGGEREDRAGD